MYNFGSEKIARLDELREDGINPYPHNLPTTHTIDEALSMIGDREKEELSLDESTVIVAGRVKLKRGKGKAGFAHIQDRSNIIQIYVRKDTVGDAGFEEWNKTSLGDFVHLTGRLMRTKTGEATLKAQSFALAAKCIESLPDKHKGFTDVESRSRQRYVDLFVNEDAREVFRRRSLIVSKIRHFFEERDYMEVETPMMHTIPGGASARPFITHHNALDIDLYLRVAPELFLKRLVVGGFERVFEINRNFRNEGISTHHNPEFTMLEFYQAYATWEDLMELTETMVRDLALEVCGNTDVTYGNHILNFGEKWRRLPFATAISEATGLTEEQVWDVKELTAFWKNRYPHADLSELPKTVGKWFERIFDEYVEKTLIQPTFLTHFPTEISPLSRRNDADPKIADRFELFIAGKEIANGFNELNDPVDQANRFAAQVQAKDAGDDEAMFFDDDYIKALSYGMPPTAGEGIGIDRLVMLLTNSQSIREVILFPTLKPKVT
jgi:lysyl-tRNA synthetase class 2